MALALIRRFSLPQIDWSLSLDWGTIHFQQDLTVSSGSHVKRQVTSQIKTVPSHIEVPTGTDNDGGDQSTVV